MKYYYKILEQAPQQPLPDTLPATELDKQDGFIHLSTAEQVPITADLFFGGYQTIYLLKVQVSKLDGVVNFDEEAGPGCPHLRHSKIGLGKSNVVEIIEIAKGQSSSWKDVTKVSELEG